MLQRIRTLAVQSANGTLGETDRKAIQNEANSLTAEITRIAQDTTFGGKNILMGYNASSIYATASDQLKDLKGTGLTNGGRLTLHVGANTDDTIAMEVYSFVFSALASAAGLAGDDYNKSTGFFLSKQADANASIAAIVLTRSVLT